MRIPAAKRLPLRRKAVRTTAFLLALLAGLGLWTAAHRAVPAQAAKGLPRERAGETEAQRQAFASALGWEISPEPCAAEKVRVPRRFDDVYTAYNALQKRQGLDLSRYRGRLCTRYTYAVYNEPAERQVRLHLLVYKGKIIGGDICSLSLGGFLRPLLPPQS